MSSHIPQLESKHANQPIMHCMTCQCGHQNEFFKWRSVKESAVAPSRVSQLVQSRVVPQHDPIFNQVGQNVIPNKTVWFKSVSPRPAKITIRVSSPDRPNLRPSESSLSIGKRPPSESRITFKGIQVSRVIDPERVASTPLKKLVSISSTNYDQNISSPNTDRKTNDTRLTNTTSQQF